MYKKGILNKMEEKAIHKTIKDYIDCLYYNEEDIKKEIEKIGEEETKNFIFDRCHVFTFLILKNIEKFIELYPKLKTEIELFKFQIMELCSLNCDIYYVNDVIDIFEYINKLNNKIKILNKSFENILIAGIQKYFKDK